MGELGDGGVKEVDKLLAGPAASHPHGADLRLEALDRLRIEHRLILDDPYGFEPVHVECFALGIELLEVLFSRGIAFEEIDRPLDFCLELLHPGPRFVFACAFHWFIAAMPQIAHRNFGEGDEIRLRVELGEEEIAVFAEKRRHEAELARFLWRHKIAPHVIRRRERLFLFHAPIETIKQASIGEGDIRKARGRDRQFKTAAHKEVFHDALRGSHHVNRICRLVGRDTEILARPFPGRVPHRLVGIEDIDIDHAHERPGVLLAAHMLERGKVEHIVVAGPISDEGVEDVTARINGEGSEFPRGIADGGAEVAHELHHVVLADIHDMEELGIAPEYLPRYRLAYRASAANDEKTRGAHDVGQFALMARNIRAEELLRAPYEIENEIHNQAFTRGRFFSSESQTRSTSSMVMVG